MRRAAPATREVRTEPERRLLTRLTTAKVLGATDQALLEKVQTIRGAKLAGQTGPTIAATLGLTPKRFYRFTASSGYKACCAYLTSLERGEPMARDTVGAEGQALAAEHRGVIRQLVPKAIQRLDLSLGAGVNTSSGRPVLVESKAADRAMEVVLQSAGLLESEAASRPSITIGTLVIQQLTETIQDDEARARAARVVSPVEIEATP